MHNAALKALGLDWRYLAFDVHPDHLGPALDGARAMGFIGLNLTVPHKLLAVERVDELDPAAREWGAVNTVRFEAQNRAGAWRPVGEFSTPPEGPVRAHGFNTDADAITRSLREDLGFEPRGTTILLLGAGGAGRTAALKLARDGARRLHLINRTRSKAEELATEIQRRFPEVETALDYPAERVDLLLNATSLGLRRDDPSPLDHGRYPITNAGAVYDMIYRPAETPLRAGARAAGCRAANGLGMLFHQGAAALELWTGRPSPMVLMRRALEEHLREKPAHA